MKPTYSYYGILSLLFFLAAQIIASPTYSADAELHGRRISIRQVTLEGEDKPSSILAEEMKLFADGAKVSVHKAPGETESILLPARTFYRGSIEGEEGSIVVISIDNDTGELKGRVSTNKNNWSLSRGLSKHIESKKYVAPKNTQRSQQTTKTIRNDYIYPGDLSANIHSHVAPSALGPNQYYVAQIAIETDSELYNHFGNAKDTTDYITNIMAFTSAVYAKEVGVVLRVQSISLWAGGVTNDPWDPETNPAYLKDISPLLFQFQSYWNTNHPDYNRAAALFISGRHDGGGLAITIGGLCSKDGYALAEGQTFSSLVNKSLVQDNYVILHELGHLFGSPHSHAYDNVDGEPNKIDGCVIGDNAQIVPTGKVPGINTLDTGTPGTRTGTIMSYCHDNSPGISNIAPSFGKNFQYGIKAYREANKISSYTASINNSNPNCINIETISNIPVLPALPKSTIWNLRKITFNDGSTLEGYLDFNSDLSSYNTSRLVFTDTLGQHAFTVVGYSSDSRILLSVDGTQDSLTADLMMNGSLLTATSQVSLVAAIGGCRINNGSCGSVTTRYSSPAVLDIASSTYVLSILNAGNGTIASSPSGINCGSTCSASFSSGASVMLTATPNSGYIFSGWSGACSGTGACAVTMNSSQSVTATFTRVPTTLSVVKVGNGSITSTPAGINCGSTCSFAYPQGSSVSLTASPDIGYSFSGWSGACSGSGACTVTTNSSQSVTATFTALPNVYSKLTVARSNRGVITSDRAMINCGTNATACSTTVQEGTVITLTAVPDNGYSIIGWSGCTSYPGDSCVLAVGGTAMWVSATFAPKPIFTLKVTKNKFGTVTSNPAWIFCKANVASCRTKLFSGTKITLTATPNAGRTFVGWSGACSGKDVCSLTMDGAKGVSALFK